MFEKFKGKINMPSTDNGNIKKTKGILKFFILIGFSLVISGYLVGAHFNSTYPPLSKIYFGVLIVFNTILYIKFSMDIVEILLSQQLLINISLEHNKDILAILENKNIETLD